jgi:hypothetical protein
MKMGFLICKKETTNPYTVVVKGRVNILKIPTIVLDIIETKHMHLLPS